MRFEVLFPVQNRHVRFLLGQYLARKRVEQGLSPEEVAFRTGLSPRIYKTIEGGRKNLDADVFSAIQDVLPLEEADLRELRRIASIRYVNDLSNAIGFNYPI